MEFVVICYLCSYPRSGNSLLQAILIQHFMSLVSRVQGESESALSLSSDHWEVRDAPDAPDGFPEGLSWGPHIGVYRRSAGATWRRMLNAGPEEALTPEVRKALSCEQEVFFVKTHGLPFDRYYDGERAIQIVRHPGPTLWSLFRYANDTGEWRDPDTLFACPPPTLEAVIEGRTRYGDWTDYLQCWEAAARALGPRHMRLMFSEVVADPLQTVERLSGFVGLSADISERISFEDYSRRWPDWDLRGANEGYERFYSRRQLALLWDWHGAMAERFGWAPPDLSPGGLEEQTSRLNSLVETAWRRGREVELESWRAVKRLRDARSVTPSSGEERG